LTLDSERVSKLVDSYDKEIKSIREDLLKMCWYMRGGVTYEEALNLSASERVIIGDLIKDNLEATKKSGLPFF
jgi:hypothetical protein